MRVQPITIDPHYSPRFYSELWCVSESTVLRWFQDLPGVLKLGEPSKKRARREIRIPFSIAMRVHEERSK